MIVFIYSPETRGRLPRSCSGTMYDALLCLTAAQGGSSAPWPKAAIRRASTSCRRISARRCLLRPTGGLTGWHLQVRVVERRETGACWQHCTLLGQEPLHEYANLLTVVDKAIDIG
jgi:hypothetical protein